MGQVLAHTVPGAATRRALPLLVLLLAFALRVSHLGAKSLWQDEIFTAAIASTGNSVLEVVTIPLYNTALPAPPLYFLITHFFLHIGDTDFLLRFPALLFGVLGIAATYTVGTRLFNRETGWMGAFLVSVSSLHVRYSQDARFYSLMVLLSLLSLYCLWRALFDDGRVWWVGFVVCSVLNVYNHLFGLLVLLAEAFFVGGLWMGQAFAGRGSRFDEGRCLTRPCSFPERFVRRKRFAFLLSSSIIMLLYGPMIPHLVRGVTGQKGLGGAVTRGLSETPTVLGQVFEAWGNGPGLTFLLFLAPFLIGLAACFRIHRRQLWMACCWLGLPLVLLLLVPARHGFRPRYILFMLPAYLIFVARGVTAGSKALGERWRSLGAAGSIACLASSVFVFALISVPVLREYYHEPRLDWKSAAALLDRSFSVGETVVSPGPFAQFALARYEPGVGEATFWIGGSELFLSSGEEGEKGVWFTGPGREAMKAAEAELRAATPLLFKVVFEVDADRAAQGIRLNIAPTMYSDLWVIYVRQGLDAEEVVQRYEEALEVVSPTVASSIHSSLGDLYQEQPAFHEAVAHYRQAIVLNPEAPEPHRRLAELYERQGMAVEAAAEWEKYEQLMDQR